MQERTLILVIDDDHQVRRACRMVLEATGFDVIEAPSAEDGLKLLLGFTSIKAIVLDNEMPRMSGLEFLQVIERYIRLASIPVILMSGQDVDIPATRSIVSFLEKPYEIDDLVFAVTAACERGRELEAS